MFQVKDRPAGPTEAQYMVVRKCFDATGVLTVKDKRTGAWVKPAPRCGGVAHEVPFQDVIPYGEVVSEAITPERAIVGSYSAETYKLRATYVLFVGSKRFPDGLAFSGYEIWTQDNFVGDTNAHSCVNFRFDAWDEERRMLHAYAEDEVYVTDEMYKAAEKTAIARRDMKLQTQADPVAVLVKALAEAATARGLPEDVLAEIARLKAENEALRGAVAGKKS